MIKAKYIGGKILINTLILFLLGLILIPDVYAIINNNQNVPDFIINDLRSHGHATITNSNSYGPGAYCDQPVNKYKQAQWSWISQINNNNSQEIRIVQGTNSVNLWFNVLAATCDRAVGPAPNGLITETNLKETQTNVISSSASVNYGSTPLSVSGLGSGVNLNLDYNLAYFFNARFVKPKNSGNNFMSEQPRYRQFSVSGLGSLQARDDPYTITVRSTDFMVNRFNSGSGDSYLCVYGATPTTTMAGNPASTAPGKGCGTVTRTFTIKLRVAKAFDASCTIMNNTLESGVPDEVKVGEEFNVTMVVGNNGINPWGTAFKLGSGDTPGDPSSNDPTIRDNNFWKATSYSGSSTVNAAQNRVSFDLPPGYPVPGSGGSEDPSVAWPALRSVKFRVRAPSTAGFYQFRWQVVEGEGPGAVWRGEPCARRIRVIDLRNTPYIGIMGGDVISGARFGSNELGAAASCNATQDAQKAHIKTNGYYGNSLAVLRGNSTSQYAVFASGVIGDDNNYTNHNSFLGDFGFNRPGTDSNSKDMLFANMNLDNSEYGRFYKSVTSPPLPCVDIRTLESSATSLGNDAAALSFLDNTGVGGNGVRSVTTPNLILNTRQIPAGTNKTLIVYGNVTITGPITYGNSYSSATAIPYLHIIANNIYIRQNAQRIDANLSAVPSWVNPANPVEQKDGVVDTCSDFGGAGVWPAAFTTNSCRQTPNSFVLNGKLEARRILWKRTSGTLNFKDEVADASCYYANYNDPSDPPAMLSADINVAIERMQKCSAELVKFNAEAYLSKFRDNVIVDSVPNSTVELPPVY